MCQQSPPIRTVNLLDMLVQLSSCPQSPNPNLLKNLHFCPCSFQVKTSRDTQPTNVWSLFLFLQTWVWRSQVSGCIHTHFHAHLHTCAPDVPTGKHIQQKEPEMGAAGLMPERGVWDRVLCFVKCHMAAGTLGLGSFSYALSAAALF